MQRSTRARTSSSSAYPPKAGKSWCHSLHSRTIHYSKVGGLRRKASDVQRWLLDRKQLAPTASKRFGLLAGGR
jgi:hypothetical protein